MKNLFGIIGVTAASLMLTAGASNAAAIDVGDWTANATQGTFFVEPGQNPTQFGSSWYRDEDQDWSWTHGAITDPYTEVSLNIGAYDVDAPPCNTVDEDCEVDEIYGYDTDTASWLLIGALDGADNTFAFTEFDLLTAAGGALVNEISAGLELMIDIDATETGLWLVSLSKSVITTDGRDPGTPNPSAVPLPAAGWLLFAGLGGLAAMRRRKKA